MRHRLSLPLLTFALLAAGCVKDATSFVEPYALCSMPDDCTFSGKCDAQYIGTPRLDVTGQTEMWIALEMHNQLEDNSDASSGRTNTHDAHFESYSVDYSGSGGLLPPSTGDIPASGGRAQMVIPAAGTSVIGVNIFPQALVADLSNAGSLPLGPSYVEVTAKVSLKGRFDDGADWETSFTVPVELCQFCVSHTCTDPTQTPLAACPNLHQIPAGAATCG